MDSPKTAGQGHGKRGSEVESASWAYVSLLYGDEFLLGLRVRCTRGILATLVYSLRQMHGAGFGAESEGEWNSGGSSRNRCRSNPTGYSNYFRAGWMEGLDV